MKIHFFNPPTSYRHMVSVSYSRMIDSLLRIKNVKLVELQEADYIFCMHNDFSDNFKKLENFSFDAKVISHLFDCRTSYNDKRFKKILKHGDSIWIGGNNFDGLMRKEYIKEKCFLKYVPVGTWETELEDKTVDISITMSPKPKERIKKVLSFIEENKEHKFRTDFTMSSTRMWFSEEKENVESSREVGEHVFSRANFNLEFTSKPQQKMPESAFWSDRQGIATSNFCHVITDYKQTLDNWDSAIGIGEPIEYNLKDLKRDIDKWNWGPILEEALKETISAI